MAENEIKEPPWQDTAVADEAREIMEKVRHDELMEEIYTPNIPVPHSFGARGQEMSM